MNEMETEDSHKKIVDALYDTWSNDNGRRKESERIFNEFEKDPLFIRYLLNICTYNNVHYNVRKLAIIYAKNLVSRYWISRDKVNLNDHVKNMVKEKLIDIISNEQCSKKLLKDKMETFDVSYKVIYALEPLWNNPINLYFQNCTEDPCFCSDETNCHVCRRVCTIVEDCERTMSFEGSAWEAGSAAGAAVSASVSADGASDRAVGAGGGGSIDPTSERKTKILKFVDSIMLNMIINRNDVTKGGKRNWNGQTALRDNAHPVVAPQISQNEAGTEEGKDAEEGTGIGAEEEARLRGNFFSALIGKTIYHLKFVTPRSEAHRLKYLKFLLSSFLLMIEFHSSFHVYLRKDLTEKIICQFLRKHLSVYKYRDGYEMKFVEIVNLCISILTSMFYHFCLSQYNLVKQKKVRENYINVKNIMCNQNVKLEDYFQDPLECKIISGLVTSVKQLEEEHKAMCGKAVSGKPVGGKTTGTKTVGSRNIGGKMVGNRTGGGKTVGNRTGGGKTVGIRTIGGKVVGSRTIGGKTVGSRTTGGKVPDGRTTGGKVPDGRTTGGKVSDSRTIGGKAPDSKTNGEKAPESKTNGEKDHDSKTNGEKDHDSKTNGEKDHDSKTNGEKDHDSKTNGEKAPESKTNGGKDPGRTIVCKNFSLRDVLSYVREEVKNALTSDNFILLHNQKALEIFDFLRKYCINISVEQIIDVIINIRDDYKMNENIFYGCLISVLTKVVYPKNVQRILHILSHIVFMSNKERDITIFRDNYNFLLDLYVSSNMFIKEYILSILVQILNKNYECLGIMDDEYINRETNTSGYIADCSSEFGSIDIDIRNELSNKEKSCDDIVLFYFSFDIIFYTLAAKVERSMYEQNHNERVTLLRERDPHGHYGCEASTHHAFVYPHIVQICLDVDKTISDNFYALWLCVLKLTSKLFSEKNVELINKICSLYVVTTQFVDDYFRKVREGQVSFEISNSCFDVLMEYFCLFSINETHRSYFTFEAATSNVLTNTILKSTILSIVQNTLMLNDDTKTEKCIYILHLCFGLYKNEMKNEIPSVYSHVANFVVIYLLKVLLRYFNKLFNFDKYVKGIQRGDSDKAGTADEGGGGSGRGRGGGRSGSISAGITFRVDSSGPHGGAHTEPHVVLINEPRSNSGCDLSRRFTNRQSSHVQYIHENLVNYQPDEQFINEFSKYQHDVKVLLNLHHLNNYDITTTFASYNFFTNYMFTNFASIFDHANFPSIPSREHFEKFIYDKSKSVHLFICSKDEYVLLIIELLKLINNILNTNKDIYIEKKNILRLSAVSSSLNGNKIFHSYNYNNVLRIVLKCGELGNVCNKALDNVLTYLLDVNDEEDRARKDIIVNYLKENIEDLNIALIDMYNKYENFL
ncbi:conserved Plasmodium protein, unknown function [Plasmodium ovale wallikeri]|uniref:Importin N-terminal domain-containing protein n=1 Tax=Plasmodium ovale wallikeri TaxID=864142 RepID=A0A1A8ZNU4_PLAOA|nr:conserved Plasmodium protein, unknown function [Plasmodium ovale wallikeri]